MRQVSGYRYGMVLDDRQFAKQLQPSITKVQPIPSRTEDTETLRMERRVPNLRKARKDRRVRAFVKNEIVPLMLRKPDRTANLRVILRELEMTEKGGEEAESAPGAPERNSKGPGEQSWYSVRTS